MQARPLLSTPDSTYRLLPGTRLTREPDTGVFIVTTASLKTYQLGDDVGGLCEFLASSEKGFTEPELQTCFQDWGGESIQRALAVLVDACIVTNHADEVGIKPKRIEFRPPFTFQWTMLDPNRICQILRPLARILTGWLAVYLSVLGLSFQAMLVSVVSTKLPSDLDDILISCVVLLAGVAVHEFSHGIVLAAEGGHSHRMGVMLFYLTPAFFCDVSDGWRLGRVARIRVALAGVASQCIFGGVVAIVVILTGFAQKSLVPFVVFNLVSVVLNLVPFLKLDGYLALSAAVDIPNLRAQSMQVWQKLVGGPALTEPKGSRLLSPDQRPWWFLPFGAICACAAPVLVAATTAGMFTILLPGVSNPVAVFTVIVLAWLLVWLIRGRISQTDSGISKPFDHDDDKE